MGPSGFSVGRLGLGGLRDRLPREGISEKAAVPLILAPSSRLNALIYPHKTLKDRKMTKVKPWPESGNQEIHHRRSVPHSEAVGDRR